MKKLKNAMELRYLAAKNTMFCKKDQGGKEVIIEITLTVVAIGLCIMFRAEIKDLLTTLIGKSKTQIDGMFTFP